MKQNISIHKAVPNTGALNFSHLLDAPAGKHGFVTAKNGHFYFENGERVRFIGFNLPARSNTPDHETAEKLAERFASMGVNVIRLHAADAPIGDEPGSWSSCREAPLLDYDSGTTRKFHPEGLDRFDYFVAKLREKGIYLHIDLIVARAFLQGDELDYPGEPGSCVKCYTMINRRMVELQKEYAEALLCHVNPYTGLRLLDDPAVMTVQINNEDSAIKGTADIKDLENIKPYRLELQRKFGHFLLAKYGSREALKTAWTFEGVCALGDDEDPEAGTVRIAEGSFLQPVNDPLGDWAVESNPARYADYMEFGIETNRRFYREMKDFLRGLGVKVPIVTSNLLGGAADVYGHIDGDLMENNSYFNHPILPVQDNNYIVGGLQEYVSMDPLTMQRGFGAARTSLISLASVAAVEGKPFVLSEWNEYGEHPFHSTVFVQTAAYACLNDWDGLILYCHHTSEHWDDQPADEILNIFDVYNDPAVICQWGFLATVFLKGLVAPASHRVEVVHTLNDLLTLPPLHSMPNTFLPYITSLRNAFMSDGDSYRGAADVAINAGFVNSGDLRQAKHSVCYAWSPYGDALRRTTNEYRLAASSKNTAEIDSGVHFGEQALVFDDIAAVSGTGDYRRFAELLTGAMQKWGVLPKGTGYVDGKLVSETGELVFDPQNSAFFICADRCAYFSGKPEKTTALTEKISLSVKNDRISLALLPKGNGEFLLTALGESGMSETVCTPTELIPGIPFTAVSMRGKLYADTVEGVLTVKARTSRLYALDVYGNVLKELPGVATENGVEFVLDGELPALHFLIKSED